jgi:hypothetical protein
MIAILSCFDECKETLTLEEVIAGNSNGASMWKSPHPKL